MLVLDRAVYKAVAAGVDVVTFGLVFGADIHDSQTFGFVELVQAFGMALGDYQQMVDHVVQFPQVILREVGHYKHMLVFIHCFSQCLRFAKWAARRFFTLYIFQNSFSIMV